MHWMRFFDLMSQATIKSLFMLNPTMIPLPMEHQVSRMGWAKKKIRNQLNANWKAEAT